MKKKGPYVGVTGFMCLSEVIACDNVFRKAAQAAGEQVAANLKFMVGVLVSSKTLLGETNSWPNRYPLVENIPDIISMENRPHLLHTIHYNTKDPSTIDEQIDQVLGISPNIDAIQLNIRWVNPVKMQRVRRKYPELRIILQVGAGALGDVAEPGDIFLGEALQSYKGVIDDFLVDPSGGIGKELDVWHAFACMSDKDIPPGMQAGMAGGFFAGNEYRAKGLMRRLGPVNRDAEGRLRTPKEDDGRGDHLMIAETQEYVQEVVASVGEAMMR